MAAISLWRQVTMCVQRLDEPSFPELVVVGVERLGDPIGVDRQKVSSGKPELRRSALPRGEQAQHRCRRLEPFDLAGASQDQRRQMSAVRVAQASRSVVELRIEKGRVGIVGLDFVKEPVHGLEKALGLIDRSGALTPQVGLKVGHQQRGRHALAGDVADDQPQTVPPKIEEIVVVATHPARLDACAADSSVRIGGSR